MNTQRTACLPLFFLAVALNGCGESATQKIAPAIVVELADPEAEEPCAQEADESQEPALDFGEVPLDDAYTLALCVRSNTHAPLTLQAFEVDGEPVASKDFGVPAPEAGRVIGPGSRQLVEVRFQPTEAREYQATLQIVSSDPRKPKVGVPLKGRGISSALRVLGCVPGKTAEGEDRCKATEVEAPNELDLGKVTIGGSQNFNVILDNRGRLPLVVNSISFKDPEDAAAQGFSLPTRPKFPLTLKALNGQGVGLSFQPPEGEERSARATVVVRSEDRNLPEVELPVVAEVVPNTPPRACLQVREVERFMTGGKEAPEVDEDGVIVVSVMDTLYLDGRVKEGCTGDDEDGTDLDVEIEFTRNPDFYAQLRAGSHPMERTFQPERFTADDESYEVGLTATDSQGLSAVDDGEDNPALVEFRVQPREDIAVEISWSEEDAGADVDLHFVKGGNPPSNTQLGKKEFDCFTNHPNQKWEQTQARLVTKDDSGQGSRTETVLAMYPGHGNKYSIYAHFSRDNRGNEAQGASCDSDADCGEGFGCASTKVCRKYVEVHTRIYLQRQKILDEVTARLLEPCDTWWIGEIEWKDIPELPTFVQRGSIAPDGRIDWPSCTTSFD